MDLVEAKSHVERRRAGLLMLTAEVIKQLVTADCQISNPALEEVAGERGFGRNNKLRRLGPVPDLAEKGAKAAEILLVSPLLGPYLGDGETKHA
jgi:hypothetical protein